MKVVMSCYATANRGLLRTMPVDNNIATNHREYDTEKGEVCSEILQQPCLYLAVEFVNSTVAAISVSKSFTQQLANFGEQMFSLSSLCQE